MQIVSLEDNLNKMSSPFFWENKKNIIDMSSAKFAQRMEKLKKKQISWSTAFPTRLHVRPAKTQISMRIRTV